CFAWGSEPFRSEVSVTWPSAARFAIGIDAIWCCPRGFFAWWFFAWWLFAWWFFTWWFCVARRSRDYTGHNQICRKPAHTSTLSKLRRLGFACFTKGECQDVAHKDDMPRFVEYAYAVQTSQTGVSIS
ncbi:MAG: hypothetical protein ABJP98_09045, partial [Marinobacter alexandrii]|uniref:hypothetical protein n=1 Tax=Marinobacter alexandrii TaxID=2570351 RepID=UPI003299BB12